MEQGTENAEIQSLFRAACAIIKTERKVIVLKTIECNDIKIVYGE